MWLFLVKTCSKLPAPLYGKINCEHPDLGKTFEDEDDLPVDSICNFSCDSGRSLVGSSVRTCLPLAQWDGLKTSCKCMLLMKFETKCSYSC